MFCQAESIINNRLITKVSSDANDDTALTPSHPKFYTCVSSWWPLRFFLPCLLDTSKPFISISYFELCSLLAIFAFLPLEYEFEYRIWFGPFFCICWCLFVKFPAVGVNWRRHDWSPWLLVFKVTSHWLCGYLNFDPYTFLSLTDRFEYLN